MNNHGFTLIELLATIVLLAVIASISFVSITAAISKGNEKNCNSIKDSIKSATIEYINDNRYKRNFFQESTMTKSMNASELINQNYLSTITNPFNKETIDPSTIMIVATLNDDYTVKQISITSSVNDWIEDCKQ